MSGFIGFNNGMVNDFVGKLSSFAVSSLVPFFHYDASEGVTLNGSDVSQWDDQGTNGFNLTQGTASQQPAFLIDTITFDGTDDQMDVTVSTQLGIYPEFATKVPDAQGGTVGEGFTNTGLSYDSVGDQFVVGNDGRSASGDSTHEPSIVFLSLDGATKNGELDMEPLIGTSTTIQGVAYDSSDDTVWFSTSTTCYHINKSTGSQIGSSFSIDGGPLAYDPTNNYLITVNSSGVIKRYNAATNAFVDQFTTGLSNIDHCFWDDANGIVWMTSGSNGTNQDGTIQGYQISSTTLGSVYNLEGTEAIEGVFIDTSTPVDGGDAGIYTNNDGFFHNTTDNRLHKHINFDYTKMVAEFSGEEPFRPGFDVTLVGKLNGNSGTDCIFSFDEPTSLGMGVFASSSTNARLIYDDGPVRATINVAVADMTTEDAIWRFVFDINETRFEVFRNGVSQGSATDGSPQFHHNATALSLGGDTAGGFDSQFDVLEMVGTTSQITSNQATNLDTLLKDKYSIS